MGDQSFLFIFAIVIVIVGALLFMSYYEQQERIKHMRALAARLGYDYAKDGAGLVTRLGGFALFSQHGLRSGQMTNLLSSEADGAALTVFDYHYTVQAGKNRHTVRQSVLLFEYKRVDLPAFALRPEGLGAKLMGILGQQDIDFAEQPDFSAAYVLQGPDEARIRALFGAEQLAFFARSPGLSVEGDGPRLLYYRARRRLSPEAIPPFVEEGRALLRLLAVEKAHPPAGEPDPLAGLDDLLADMGVEEGTADGQG